MDKREPNFQNYSTYFKHRVGKTGGGLATFVRNDLISYKKTFNIFFEGQLEVLSKNKFLYLGFKRLINLKFSFLHFFFNIIVLLESGQLKNSLYSTSNIFSFFELIGRKVAASA